MRSLSNSSHESPTPSETLDDNGWFRQRSPAILMKSSRTILRNSDSASDPRHNTVIGSIATAFNFGTTSSQDGAARRCYSAGTTPAPEGAAPAFALALVRRA